MVRILVSLTPVFFYRGGGKILIINILPNKVKKGVRQEYGNLPYSCRTPLVFIDKALKVNELSHL